MTPERWQQVDSVLQAALERPPDKRAAFLDEVCAGDEPLRKEVESLISFHELASSFIESPALQDAAQLLAPSRDRETFVGRLVGPYKIVEPIGRGGMGEVYLAKDSRLGRPVALKLLPAEFTRDPQRLRRFKQEARAASALNHPNILTIHDIGVVDGSHYIATEFIDGRTLRRCISSAELKLPQVLDLGTQVASGLSAAHEAGIVHRDIKPENIMLRTDGYVKILDFGIAKLTENSADSDVGPTLSIALETVPGIAIGTPRYMSPEQARGQGVDARTDIFSLGAVLYEMVSGRAPFEGETAADVIVSILEKEPTPLTHIAPEAPPELERIVARALRKDREERYQSAGDLALDLKSLRDGSSIAARTQGADLGGGRRNSNRRGLISSLPGRPRKGYLTAAAATIALAGVIAVIIALKSEPPVTLAEFNDDFRFFNPNRWNMPSAGWAVESGRLHIENAPTVGFPKNLHGRDFIAQFHLRLANAGGAAWALRIEDADNYYLFYLSGPEGLFPGYFNTYIVRNGKFDPSDHFKSTFTIVELRPDAQYDVVINVSNNTIDHTIIPADTGAAIKLDHFEDPGDHFPRGSVGFRTVGAERFSVDDFFVLPAKTPHAASNPN